MPRRVADVRRRSSTFWNQVRTIRSFFLVVSALLLRSSTCSWSLQVRQGRGTNPWGARTLEWMTSSPPPYYNFKHIPTVTDCPYDFGEAAAVRGARRRIDAARPRDDRGADRGRERGVAWLTRSRDVDAMARYDAAASTPKRAHPALGLRALPRRDSCCSRRSSSPICTCETRRRRGRRPHGHQPRLDVAFAALNSVVLFGSGVTMHFALETGSTAKGASTLWLLATIVLGALFLCGQALRVPERSTSTWSGGDSSARRSSP